MTEYRDTEAGCDITFSIQDDDKPYIVDAWVEKLPGETIDQKTRAAEAAVERATGRKVKLLCRYASGSDYRFEIVGVR